MPEAQFAGSAMIAPAEAHHFHLKDRWYLFDVEALTVLPSSESDGTILALARDGIARDALIREAKQQGVRGARRRVGELFEAGFLKVGNTCTDKAPLAAHAGYATFMVNVSQRCNL